MESKSITVNSVNIKVFSDGSIEKPSRHGGKTHTFGGRSNAYNRTRIGDKSFHVHRLVALAFLDNYSEELEVDHIDGNGVNNDINNLRMLTKSDNLRAHRRISSKASSKYRGVSWQGSRNKWCARIKTRDSYKWLGRFQDEVEAALAFNKAAIEDGFPIEGLNKI
jgi:hypothetical protein